MHKSLIRAFKRHHDFQISHPAWAYERVPSIPFVGSAYEPERGVLVYASAENFSWMQRKDAPERRYHAAVDDARSRQACETSLPGIAELHSASSSGMRRVQLGDPGGYTERG
ncbi:MAG: hypothetical protein HYV27_23905 [Candidatus Hydrogenedentes bacterium]|nr:hypothetical protein [Candidatus Hydrogenedentota bacterium]